MSALTDLLTPAGAPLIRACVRYGLGSPLEQAHFYAQAYEESAGFTKMSEDLNYRVTGLLRVFKKHFTPQEALEYAHHPERIANRAYANRMGNGDEASGDGWRFRGRAWPEITGRTNYAQLSHELFGDDRLVQNPDLLEQPETAANAYGHFWLDHDCGTPAMHDDIEGVTEKVNGGLTGLDARKEALRKFKLALGVKP